MSKSAYTLPTTLHFQYISVFSPKVKGTATFLTGHIKFFSSVNACDNRVS